MTIKQDRKIVLNFKKFKNIEPDFGNNGWHITIYLLSAFIINYIFFIMNMSLSVFVIFIIVWSLFENKFDNTLSKK